MGPNQTDKFYTAKETIKKKKDNQWNGKKIVSNDATDKGLISKYTNNSYNSTAKKPPTT